MKVAVCLAALVALAVCYSPAEHVTYKSVDAEFILRQKKVLELVDNAEQYWKHTEWYKIGESYDLAANKEKYTNKKAFEEFWTFYESGLLPKHKTFSIFYDRMRLEAAALAKLFYFAKDFETFYNTAAFARVHFNHGLFLYSYYYAVMQRPDTKDLVLPAPYELYPQYFVNSDTILKAQRIKMQDGIIDPVSTAKYGLISEKNYYVLYSNYSSPWFTDNEEQKISYFTEDVGMNSYYYVMNLMSPFWMKDGSFKDLKNIRGEVYAYLYQQLLARYYLERLSNGMSEIPKLSWNKPLETGYICDLFEYYPFLQRNDFYEMTTPKNEEYLTFLKSFELSFVFFLHTGVFPAYNEEIPLSDPKAERFAYTYWFPTLDISDKSGPRNYETYYEIIGRRILAGTPEPADQYSIYPSALELDQTALRDPAFYQFYGRILNYINEFKNYLKPYSSELHFEGVKINNVKFDKLVTYFDYFDFDIDNFLYYSQEEFKGKRPYFKVRQPRLNHKPFNVTVDIKSEVATDAVVKFFLGPKYDSNGYPLSIEDNWMNFVLLDSFTYKLTTGINKIERSSNQFQYKEDSIPVTEVYKMMESGKVPLDMSEYRHQIPNRMMLPRGQYSGFPVLVYVVVYPYTPLSEEYAHYTKFFTDSKPTGYPFNRPIHETYFKQPNIYQEDVFIYHEGEEHPNIFNYPGHFHTNEVSQHV